MADLSHLSDSELDAAIKAQAPDVSHLSDADLDAAIKAQSPAAPEQGMLEKAGRWAVNALPTAGAITGGILATPGDLVAGPASNVLGAAGGAMVGQAAKDWINSKIDPENAPKSLAEGVKNLPGAAVGGALTEVGGQLAGKALGAAANSAYIKPWLDDAGQLVMNGFNKAGQYVGAGAEKLATMATGATGAQARQFAPGTGRALLDNGIVKFGRSQSGIADAASDYMDTQTKTIKDAIDELGAQGATGSKTDLLAGLQDKIDELAGQTSQAPVVKQLKGIMEEVAAGPETPDIGLLQLDKQGYQGRVNWANPEGNSALKKTSEVYRNAVESAAHDTDSTAATALTDANQAYHQMEPIATASEKRALTTQQSPTGGLGDMVSYGVGGVPGVIAKKIVMPRINSSLASTANGLSQILTKTPQVFGKYAAPLAAAAARGETSLAASSYVLQQRDPGFRQKMQELNNHEPGAPEMRQLNNKGSGAPDVSGTDE